MCPDIIAKAAGYNRPSAVCAPVANPLRTWCVPGACHWGVTVSLLLAEGEMHQMPWCGVVGSLLGGRFSAWGLGV